MSLRKEMLRQDQTIISTHRLHELLQKEAQLDGYVRTGQQMQRQRIHHQELMRDTYGNPGTEATYHRGWLDAMMDYDELAVDIINQQWDAHPHLDDDPKPIRKGQTCIIRQPGCYCLAAVRD